MFAVHQLMQTELQQSLNPSSPLIQLSTAEQVMRREVGYTLERSPIHQRQPVMVTLESPVNPISRFLDYEGEPAQADQLVHSNPKPPNQSTFIIFVFLKIGAN